MSRRLCQLGRTSHSHGNTTTQASLTKRDGLRAESWELLFCSHSSNDLEPRHKYDLVHGRGFIEVATDVTRGISVDSCLPKNLLQGPSLRALAQTPQTTLKRCGIPQKKREKKIHAASIRKPCYQGHPSVQMQSIDKDSLSSNTLFLSVHEEPCPNATVLTYFLTPCSTVRHRHLSPCIRCQTTVARYVSFYLTMLRIDNEADPQRCIMRLYRPNYIHYGNYNGGKVR